MPSAPEININYKAQYFLFQILGWGALITLIAIFNFNENGFNGYFFLFLVFVFIVNFSISHLYRNLINKLDWLNNKIQFLAIKIIGTCSILGVLFSVTINLLAKLLTGTNPSLIELGDVFFGAMIYFIWSILYIGYLLFYKARREEYKNMQLVALSAEVELKNLRSQLNPHFMFNAMNSIRALIDENPSKSKEAVTKLSNVLRNSLIHSNKKKVTLQEELSIVRDYLALEKIRYEERLLVNENIAPETLSCLVPPLLIQTLVENGIKHGVSQFIKGGKVTLESSIAENKTRIVIKNTGKLNQTNNSETHIGIENTNQRLNLLYGNKSSFDLYQEGECVVAEIQLPIN